MIDTCHAALGFFDQATFTDTQVAIVTIMQKLLKADFGTIFLHQNGFLKRAYASNPIINASPIHKHGRTEETFHRREPLVAHVRNKRDINKQQFALGIKSIVFIPLFYKNQAIGVLNIFSKSDLTLTQSEMQELKHIGEMGYLSLEKARKFDEIKKLLDRRDLFISYASHEFNNPLTAISIYSDLIYQHIQHKNIPPLIWAQTIKAESTRLIRLVNEFLTIENINKGRLTYKPSYFRLYKLIERALLDFTISYPDFHIRLLYRVKNPPITLRGDFDKLLQVILNLLNNAAKFSDNNKNITIKVSHYKDHAIISIKDQGRGISKTDLPHIFKGFYRGGDNQKEGLGLGLFLCKTIVERHKGTITIESQEGEGTNVIVRLPLTSYGKTRSGELSSRSRLTKRSR